MGVTGYERDMYHDISKIARAAERAVPLLERIADALEGLVENLVERTGSHAEPAQPGHAEPPGAGEDGDADL